MHDHLNSSPLLIQITFPRLRQPILFLRRMARFEGQKLNMIYCIKRKIINDCVADSLKAYPFLRFCLSCKWPGLPRPMWAGHMETFSSLLAMPAALPHANKVRWLLNLDAPLAISWSSALERKGKLPPTVSSTWSGIHFDHFEHDPRSRPGFHFPSVRTGQSWLVLLETLFLYSWAWPLLTSALSRGTHG